MALVGGVPRPAGPKLGPEPDTRHQADGRERQVAGAQGRVSASHASGVPVPHGPESGLCVLPHCPVPCGLGSCPADWLQAAPSGGCAELSAKPTDPLGASQRTRPLPRLGAVPWTRLSLRPLLHGQPRGQRGLVPGGGGLPQPNPVPSPGALCSGPSGSSDGPPPASTWCPSAVPAPLAALDLGMSQMS